MPAHRVPQCNRQRNYRAKQLDVRVYAPWPRLSHKSPVRGHVRSLLGIDHRLVSGVFRNSDKFFASSSASPCVKPGIFNYDPSDLGDLLALFNPAQRPNLRHPPEHGSVCSRPASNRHNTEALIIGFHSRTRRASLRGFRRGPTTKGLKRSVYPTLFFSCLSSPKFLAALLHVRAPSIPSHRWGVSPKARGHLGHHTLFSSCLSSPKCLGARCISGHDRFL